MHYAQSVQIAAVKWIMKTFNDFLSILKVIMMYQLDNKYFAYHLFTFKHEFVKRFSL